MRGLFPFLVSLGACTLLLTTPCFASNGMNMIGFGTRAISMGGAGVAIADDGAAINLNPAGLAHIRSQRIEGGASFMFPDITHTDALGNNVGDNLDRIPSPYLTYVRPFNSWVLGVGVFMQGGTGVSYEGLRTPFGTTDRLKTEVGHVKAIPAFAYRFNDNLSVGVSLNLSYARAKLAMFPETSVVFPGGAFSGIDVDNPDAFGIGASIGFQYRLGDWRLRRDLLKPDRSGAGWRQGHRQHDGARPGQGGV